jgi:hypothetical protein
MWNMPSRKASSQLCTDIRFNKSPILSKDAFLAVLALEIKRTERSHRPFVLMLLECRRLLKPGGNEEVIEKFLAALARSVRETDVGGWHEDRAVVGVIFTEIGEAEGRSIAGALLTRVTKALSGILTIEQTSEITMSFRVYPEAGRKLGPASELQQRHVPSGDNFEYYESW